MPRTIPATVEEQITAGKKEEISFRNLHKEAYICNTVANDCIRIPLNDVMSEYKHFLQPYIIEIDINDEELRMYQYNPKMLSNNLYGSTEYWAILLMINNCISKIHFNMTHLKVLDPKRVRGFINEVLILENIL